VDFNPPTSILQSINNGLASPPEEHIGSGPIDELDTKPQTESPLPSFECDSTDLCTRELILPSHRRLKEDPRGTNAKLLDTKRGDRPKLEHVSTLGDELSDIRPFTIFHPTSVAWIDPP